MKPRPITAMLIGVMYVSPPFGSCEADLEGDSCSYDGPGSMSVS
jgi:hypothetical protein